MVTNSKKRVGSGVAALVALGLVGMLGVAAPASAAGVDPYNIDTTKLGSISLTKYSTPASERTSTEQDGKLKTGKPTANSVLLAGATFELYKLDNTTLTTNAGWASFESLLTTVGPHPTRAALTAAGATTTLKSTSTTPANGQVQWTQLPLGAYYVVETSTPAGHKASAPFLVTVPMTDPSATNSWMYDIFVYPKNIQDNTVKVPQDTETNSPGDKLSWDIRTTIPTTTVSKMIFEDTLPASLTYDSALGVQMQIGTTWGGSGNTTLVLNTDYTVTFDTPTNKVTATLTAAGNAKLNANMGLTLIARFNTVVGANYVGVINNVAKVITNKPGSTTDTEEVTTPGSTSKFGKITINKTTSAGSPLTGAEFVVYYSHKAAPDFTKTTDPVLGVKATGVVCKMTGGATNCSDELRFSDFAENTQLTSTDARWNHYWLVETKAPQGYELLTEPIGFDITNANTTAPSYAMPAITVKNVKHGGGLELPFTGGTGSTAFAITGIALLVGGGVLLFVRSRRSRAEATRGDNA